MARYVADDAEFMTDLRAAVIRGPRISASALLLAIFLVLGAGIYWTSQAHVPLVTRGEGQVIPSSQVQKLQDLEGGIVDEILVREGQLVKAGDVLMRKSGVPAIAKEREERARYLSLIAQADRLQAQVAGREPVYDAEVMAADPSLAERENSLFRAQKLELEQAISVIVQQAEQSRREIREVESRIEQARRSLALAREELGILEPLVQSGVTSRVELLRVRRQISELEGDLETSQEKIPRLQAAIAESNQRISQARATAKAQANKEFNEVVTQRNALRETLVSSADRVRRTEIRSPVDGTIKQVHLTTIGGVIRPGVDLIEIVPLEDSLLIEARIRPDDRGFVHPGQAAKVKITAYDYTDYGSLEAEVEDISPDTIVDEQGESFYQIRVRTQQNYLGKEDQPLPIKVGMVAQVDIVTGDRTILEYLIKPILRAREAALREP